MIDVWGIDRVLEGEMWTELVGGGLLGYDRLEYLFDLDLRRSVFDALPSMFDFGRRLTPSSQLYLELSRQLCPEDRDLRPFNLDRHHFRWGILIRLN